MARISSASSRQEPPTHEDQPNPVKMPATRNDRASRRSSRPGPGFLCLLLAVLAAPVAVAQQNPPAPAPSATLQPTLAELRSTLAGLRIAKWKAPGPVRDEAEQNAASINRDLEGTLPGLLDQMDAAPASVAASFAVYRNLDALYEVVLRVSATADLAAPDVESNNLSHSLTTLEAARRALGDSILATSRALDLARQQEQQHPAAAPTQPAAIPPTTLVKDGPAAAPARRKARPRPATPPAPQP